MNRTEHNYAKARLRLDKQEAELARAFNAWSKTRAQVKRYEARLDKGVNKRASEIGGELDWRELARMKELRDTYVACGGLSADERIELRQLEKRERDTREG